MYSIGDKRVYTIGDILYYCDKDSKKLKRGVVLGVYNRYLQLDTGTVMYEDVYYTKEDCEKSMGIRTSNSKMYLSMINSVEDLIRFLYTHNVCDEQGCIDYEARSVAQIKAKELLGINL